MPFQIYPDDKEVTLGNTFEVFGGFVELFHRVDMSPYPGIDLLHQKDGAEVSAEWAADVRTEAMRLRRAHSRVLGPEGMRLLNTIIATFPMEPPSAKFAMEGFFKGVDPVWLHVFSTLMAPNEKIFLAEWRAFFKSIRPAWKRSLKGRTPPPAKAWERSLQRRFRPFYKRVVAMAMEDYLEAVPKAQRVSARFAEGRYRYGRLDPTGQMHIDVDQIVEDREGRLTDSVKGVLDRVGSDVDGMTAEQIDAYLKGDFEKMLKDEGFGKPQAVSETAATVNHGRIAGMARKGVQHAKWVSKRDDKVRETHVIYNDSKPRPVGFNYAKLSRGAHILRWPYDEECEDAGEIVNCRCILRDV